MGETTASNSALQVSVSFGRFENDSLSWERWSSFSPNKYLEEVEKCATPGSVAQKKAYFEAHYKKIAARKAELLAQEKEIEKESFRSEDQNGIDLSGNGSNSFGTGSEFGISNTRGTTEEQDKQEIGISSAVEMGRCHVDDLKEEVAVLIDCQSSSVEVKNKEVESGSHGSDEIDAPQEDVCIKEEEFVGIEAEDVKEISHVVYKEIEKALEVKEKDVKLDHSNESKVIPVNRENNVAKTKKKPVVPKSKASQISTPRSSKPNPTSNPKPMSNATITLASATSTKKGNSPSLPKRQITSSVENKKVANKSLHMSMSLGPSNPDPVPQTTTRKSLIIEQMEQMENKKVANRSLDMSMSLSPSNPDPVPQTTIRKSFIMEQMGHKDIVKRAFKTFQNNFSQSKISDEVDITSVKKQVSSRVTVSKVPTSTALRKENGRPTTIERMDKRSGNAVQTVGPKTVMKSEKGKESSRKVEKQINSKEVERTRLQTKLKEEKEAEMKKLKHDFKATPLPTLYHGPKVSKSRT